MFQLQRSEFLRRLAVSLLVECEAKSGSANHETTHNTTTEQAGSDTGHGSGNGDSGDSNSRIHGSSEGDDDEWCNHGNKRGDTTAQNNTESECSATGENRMTKQRRRVTAHELFLGLAHLVDQHRMVHEAALACLAEQLAFHAHFFGNEESVEFASTAAFTSASSGDGHSHDVAKAELRVLLTQLGRGATAAVAMAQECIGELGSNRGDVGHGSDDGGGGWRGTLPWFRRPEERVLSRLKTTRAALEQAMTALDLSERCAMELIRGKEAPPSGAPASTNDIESREEGEPTNARRSATIGTLRTNVLVVPSASALVSYMFVYFAITLLPPLVNHNHAHSKSLMILLVVHSIAFPRTGR